MESVEIRIVNAEALRVGPGEVLIVKLPDDSEESLREAAVTALEDVGLGGRSLVISGADLAVVERSSL